MKDSSMKVLMIKIVFFCVFGLCSLPFLAVIAQYLDMNTGFSQGRGFHTNSLQYVMERPLIYMLIFFVVCIILGVVYCLRCLALRKK